MRIKQFSKSRLVINRFGNNDNTATAANAEAKDLGFTKRPEIVKFDTPIGKVERRTYTK